MRDENKKIRDFLGVTEYHELGYRGSRVKAACDAFRDDLAIAQGHKVEYVGATQETTDHRSKTAWTAWEFAPDVTLVPVPMQNGFIAYLDNLDKLGVTVLFSSDYNGEDTENLDWIMSRYPYMKIVSSAGNDGNINGWIGCKSVFGIGAYNLENGVAIPRADSTPSNAVDFSGPSGVSVQYNPFAGVGVFIQTSCACPSVAALFILLDDYAIATLGRPYTRDEAYEILRAGRTAKDLVSGYGPAKLPELDAAVPATPITPPISPPVTNYGDHSDWATDAVKYVVDNKIINGDGQGNFRWHDNITREEMAQILYNTK